MNSGPITEIQPHKLAIYLSYNPLSYALVSVCSNLVLVSPLVSSLNGMQEESADGVNSTENPFPLYGLRARTLRVLQNRPGKRRVVGEENLTSMRLRTTVHLQRKCNRRKCSRDCITHVRTYVLCGTILQNANIHRERAYV